MASAATKSATEVVNRAVQKISKAPSITAKFTIIQNSQENTGELIMSNNLFHMALPGMSSWYDGKRLWSYSQAAGEVNLTEPTRDEIYEVNPITYVITAKDAFNKRMLKSQKSDEDVVEMTPKQKKDTAISKIIATFNAKTSMPMKLIIYHSNGKNVITVRFKSIKIGKMLPISAFRYNPKELPGIEVIDLR